MANYKTVFTNKGGRDGVSREKDGNVEFTVVNVLDGKAQPENTTNPEHLFAAALASCYGGAFLWHMEQAGKSSDATFEVEVEIEADPNDGENRIKSVLRVDAPDLSQEEKEHFMALAKKTSPYTKIFSGKAVLELE